MEFQGQQYSKFIRVHSLVSLIHPMIGSDIPNQHSFSCDCRSPAHKQTP